jgi:hypothetical protein
MAAARALLLLALLTLAPHVASAQVTGAVPPLVVTPRTPPPSTIPSGPDFTLLPPTDPALRPLQTFVFRPSVFWSEHYTDNFDLSEHGRRSNLRSAIGPAFSLFLDRGPLTGEAAYSLSLFHDTAEDAFGYFNSFVGRLSWEATPRLRLNAAYLLSQSDEPERADRLDLRQERREFTIHTFTLDAIYGVGAIELRPHYRLSHFSSSEETTISQTVGMGGSLAVDKIHTISAGYDHLRSETDSESTITSADGSNSSSLIGHEVTAAVARELTARATAGLSGAYAAREQTTRFRRTEFTRWNLSIFNNYVLPERLVVRANIGVSQLNGDQSTGRPLVTTSSSLSYWFGDAVATLLVERGLAESFGEGANVGVVETSGVAASLMYPFTPLTRGAVNASYRENKFTGEGDIGGGSGRAGEEQTTLRGSVSLSVQLLRWLASSLEYAYTDASSSEAGRAFTENSVRLRFDASF